MTSTDAYIYIVIGLLGVAYPILLQVIARLDEKYSSENIVELFDKEIAGKVFKYSLFTALFFVFIWSLKLEPLFQITGINLFINNSASILIALSTIILVIAFFFFVNKILIYYTPTKFIKYLKQKHDKSNEDFKYFIAQSDILLLSIKTQQRNVALTLSNFFYSAFKKEREKFKDEPVIYPDVYYEVVHRSIEELAILKEKRNYSLEYRTAGGIWLFGELEGNELSGKTYSWLWRNLLLIIKYDQDNMILYHWETAHQFYNYSLQSIQKDFDYSGEVLTAKNQIAVDKRNNEREKFLEFHYALGGLLTYKQKYNCLSRIFNHTNSEPPKYVLLPESMTEIFKFFYLIRDPYDIKYSWISHQYSFPEQSGINSDHVTKKWICSYMAILFLRQYTIVPYLITMKPLDFPQIPKTQGEIKEWIDGLEVFRSFVSEHLENKKLLQSLNLNFLTRDWCKEKGIIYPLDFFDTFKINLQEVYHVNALALEIHPEKVAQFESTSSKIIESSLSKILKANNEKNIDADTDKWYINGQRMLYTKDAFSEESEVHYIDYDSFLASYIAKELVEKFALTFIHKKSKTYILKPEDIFKAIDKLNLNDQNVIVGFGFDFNFFINSLEIQELSDEKYKNIKIISLGSTRTVNSALFLLKRSELPIITTCEISKDEIDKYNLRKISDFFNIYASVIDLNKTNKDIFEENKYGKEENEVRKSALLTLGISTEIKWKKKIEIIEIIQHSEYRQMGVPNNLSEVKNEINNKKKTKQKRKPSR